MACLTGLGGVRADQTLIDSLQQDAQAMTNQVSANESLSDFVNPENPAGSKGSGKSIKLGGSSKKTSTKKTTKKKSSKTKKSKTKKSKKSKSGKFKKKSSATSEIDIPSEIG